MRHPPHYALGVVLAAVIAVLIAVPAAQALDQGLFDKAAATFPDRAHARVQAIKIGVNNVRYLVWATDEAIHLQRLPGQGATTSRVRAKMAVSEWTARNVAAFNLRPFSEAILSNENAYCHADYWVWSFAYQIQTNPSAWHEEILWWDNAGQMYSEIWANVYGSDANPWIPMDSIGGVGHPQWTSYWCGWS